MKSGRRGKEWNGGRSREWEREVRAKGRERRTTRRASRSALLTSSPHLVASAERSSNQAQAQGPTTRRRRATPTSLAADDNRRARSPPRAISSDSGSRESTTRRQAPDRVRHGPPKVRLEGDPRALCAVRSSAVNSMTGSHTGTTSATLGPDRSRIRAGGRRRRTGMRRPHRGEPGERLILLCVCDSQGRDADQ
jgi:hypothetical protein